MFWIISCVAKPNVDELRDKLRPVHLDYLKSKKSVLVISGRTESDDGSKITGSMFLLNVQTLEEAKAFSAAEPFTQAGMFESITFTRMAKGQWNPESVTTA